MSNSHDLYTKVSLKSTYSTAKKTPSFSYPRYIKIRLLQIKGRKPPGRLGGKLSHCWERKSSREKSKTQKADVVTISQYLRSIRLVLVKWKSRCDWNEQSEKHSLVGIIVILPVCVCLTSCWLISRRTVLEKKGKLWFLSKLSLHFWSEWTTFFSNMSLHMFTFASNQFFIHVFFCNFAPLAERILSQICRLICKTLFHLSLVVPFPFFLQFSFCKTSSKRKEGSFCYSLQLQRYIEIRFL